MNAMHRGAIAALALIAIAVRSQAISQTPSAASILGRVVDATSGQPVAGTIVTLEPAGKQAPIVTGSDGQFLFRQLPPGLYRITASKPGYLNSGYGQMRARGQGTMLLLAENARRDDIAIRMWPWGAITGKVVDEYGRPVAGLAVLPWRHGPNGQLVPPEMTDALPRTIGSIISDSNGQYAIPHLRPGRYIAGILCGTYASAASEVVTAVVAPIMPGLPQRQAVLADRGGTSFTAASCAKLPSSGGRDRLYVSAFYGDAGSPSAATPIDVRPGDTAYGIDFTLRSQLSNRVAGRIVGVSQLATSGTMVRLVPADWNPTSSDWHLHQSIARPDGSFVFVAVTPGSYRIYAHAQERYWIDQTVSIDKDIDDLVVAARTGVKIAGRIQTDGAPAGSRSFEIHLNGRWQTVHADASGSFVISDVDPVSFAFWPRAATSESQIVSATLAGREVLGTTLDTGGRDMSGVVVHLSDRPASIAGKVSDPRGAQSPNPSVVLFPADPSLWSSGRDDSPIFRSARSTAGYYVLERIPSGEYVLAAVDDAALEEWPDAALLSRIAAMGQRIRVSVGQHIERDLRVEVSIR